MKKAIVVGSGAGGATAAIELQGKFEVTVIEAGGTFRPYRADLSKIESIKHTGVLLDERMIHMAFRQMWIGKTSEGMELVRGLTQGGSTTISAGNALRCDDDLKALGIDLDKEFDEIYREIPVSTAHEKNWHETTRQAYRICADIGLGPEATPKMIYDKYCIGCGKCVLGCPRGAKWDSRRFLHNAVKKGAHLFSNHKVSRVVIENGRASGVVARNGWKNHFYAADLVVLAAGGLGTPEILQNSGIRCEDRLSVDPVLCVAAPICGARQNEEIPMPFMVKQESFIISPYFDFLSFFFNRRWHFKSAGIYSMMIKLADDGSGNMKTKRLTAADHSNLREGVEICRQILKRLGKKDSEIFTGTLNAGHPGGMLPLTEREAGTFHHGILPENLYIADATLLPRSLGKPAILTVMAMAKRAAKECLSVA
jgi:choline dehydrogenase-like flavoprotein